MGGNRIIKIPFHFQRRVMGLAFRGYVIGDPQAAAGAFSPALTGRYRLFADPVLKRSPPAEQELPDSLLHAASTSMVRCVETGDI